MQVKLALNVLVATCCSSSLSLGGLGLQVCTAMACPRNLQKDDSNNVTHYYISVHISYLNHTWHLHFQHKYHQQQNSNILI